MRPQHIKVVEICERAAALYGCEVSDIFGPSRTKTIAEARKLCMYAARERLGWSYPELGIAFGRDHTSVMSAVTSIDLQRRHVAHIANAVRILLLPVAEAAE